MVNESELLTDPVTVNKPKMLTGLSQTARSWLLRLQIEAQGHHATGKEAGPNPFMLLTRNTVNLQPRPDWAGESQETLKGCRQRRSEKANAAL